MNNIFNNNIITVLFVYVSDYDCYLLFNKVMSYFLRDRCFNLRMKNFIFE